MSHNPETGQPEPDRRPDEPAAESATADRTAEGAESELSPAERRERRILELENGLAAYDGPRTDREIQQRAAETYFEFTEAAAELGDISEEAEAQIEARVGQEVDARQARLDGYRDSQSELRGLRAEGLLDSLAEAGVVMDQATRAEATALLTSPEIVNIDRRKLVKVLKLDTGDRELMARLAERELVEQYGRLVRDGLIEACQERFDGSELRLAGGQTVEVEGEMIDMDDLTDPEYADLGPEQIRQIVDQIVSDRAGGAGQGMFWNALIPRNLPFVLKTARRTDDPEMASAQRTDLLQYPLVRQALGQRFLPKQAVFHTDGSEQLSILQERVPLAEMTAVRTHNIDQLTNGQYAPEMSAALRGSSDNRRILEEFLDGAERLYRDHRLVIDTVGDNVFFRLDQDGRLDIKLVDYGCAKQWGEQPDEHIQLVMNDLSKLRKAFVEAPADQGDPERGPQEDET